MLSTPFLGWCSLAQSQQTQDRNLTEVRQKRSRSQGQRQRCRWYQQTPFHLGQNQQNAQPSGPSELYVQGRLKGLGPAPCGEAPTGALSGGLCPSWEPFSLQIKTAWPISCNDEGASASPEGREGKPMASPSQQLLTNHHNTFS